MPGVREPGAEPPSVEPPILVRGPVLPGGDPREVLVVDGRVASGHADSATLVAEGWIVPGLVDAHCHIGLDGRGPVGPEEQEAQALADRDAGALLIRDCGSAADTSWIQRRDDLPRLVRAGRHIARTRRYIPRYADEVEPEDLVATVTREARRGDGWVKLVGDWISREEGDLRPSFAAEDLAAAVRAAHALGARVTAHCFGEEVLPGLLDAGIDCIEHGTGLSEPLIAQMAGRGVALVPTVMQTERFPEYAAAGAARYPAYSATMSTLFRRRRETLMAAYDAGVPLFAGTDGGGLTRHGNLAGEVLALAEMGVPVLDALGAASWRARAWLGFEPGLGPGAPADLVVYPEDPRADLRVLRHPSRVVLRGRVVA